MLLAIGLLFHAYVLLRKLQRLFRHGQAALTSVRHRSAICGASLCAVPFVASSHTHVMMQAIVSKQQKRHGFLTPWELVTSSL